MTLIWSVPGHPSPPLTPNLLTQLFLFLLTQKQQELEKDQQNLREKKERLEVESKSNFLNPNKYSAEELDLL